MPPRKPYHRRENIPCSLPKLKAWMAKNHVSQLILAEEVGVTQCTFSNWMSGESQPRLGHIRKLITVTGLTFEQLF